jgi:GT2 family glycosyltransferase
MSPDVAVDIVIPVYGQPQLVSRCIDSVLRTVPGAQPIVVDDCSPGAEIGHLLRDLSERGKVHAVRTPTNLGFIGATHFGARLGRAPFLLFLNSDAEAFENGWLTRLLPKDETVAVVGAKLVFPAAGPLAGRIQHAGVARDSRGVPYHPFIGWPPDTPAANERRDVNAVTGGCMLVRRTAWVEEGGWDNEFGRGVYEDVDLCWRLRRRGLRVLYEPSAVLTHVEGGSRANDGHHLLFDHQPANLARLQAKWRGIGSDEALFYGEVTGQRWLDAQPFLVTAHERLMADDSVGARISIERALALAPDHFEAQLFGAALQSRLGRLSAAISHLEAAVALRPADLTVRMLALAHYLAEGRIEESTTTLDFVCALSPFDPDVAQRAAGHAALLKAGRVE